ncbi:MAG: formate dehydrogenase accessory sulfurtransferase FdhD [Xanthomonadales bacterium]|nr:formate dehydrogenase accessory sulfurtransferase FdhD [Xanthomonadales bacterium]
MSEAAVQPGLDRLPGERHEAGACMAVLDEVAVEVPVVLVYNGHDHAVLMASPGDLADFALGHSLAEGIVAAPGELDLVDIRASAAGIAVQMAIPPARFHALAGRNRALTAPVGCGLCGAASLAAAIRPTPALPPGPVPSAAEVAAAFAALPALQVLNARCGGLHAAAVVHAGGLLVREDVGRHNALDKVIGARARAGLDGGFALVTSRASHELVHKTASAGLSALAAISAPTTLAVRLAREAGLALFAFARGGAVTVYSPGGGVGTADAAGVA